jgi:transcriptional repressor NrdR
MSAKIGDMIMEALAKLDTVAYVRYASVYKDFRELKDFEEFLETLAKMTKPKGEE